MFDDYEQYEIVCKYCKVDPVGFGNNPSFYAHESELFKKNNVKDWYEFYNKIIKKNE